MHYMPLMLLASHALIGVSISLGSLMSVPHLLRAVSAKSAETFVPQSLQTSVKVVPGTRLRHLNLFFQSLSGANKGVVW